MDPQRLALLELRQVISYFQTARIALVAYEYFITFGLEVELFWKRKVALASVLFFMNRYVPFIVNMMNSPFIDVPQQYFPWALFSALRAYVLSSRTRALAYLVFLLSLVTPVFDFIGLGTSVLVNSPSAGCNLTPNLSTSTRHTCTSLTSDPVLIVSRTCLITSDILVLGITWNATYRASREIKALGQRTSLSDILFRDGVVYFVALLIMNILHLTFSLLSVSTTRASAAGSARQHWQSSLTPAIGKVSPSINVNATSNIIALVEPMTAILVSRFLMDLQQANNSMAQQGSLSALRSLNLSNLIGSIAASLPAPGSTTEPQACHAGDNSTSAPKVGEERAAAIDV
ncbi:hypothetical protein C8Q76DRAFT_793560 [Earliella scabrosa]|nr:hypothetical protein C8Q76DRAFT_793560 [Earliella scabrosa]